MASERVQKLSTVPKERWQEIRKELPGILDKIGPTVPKQLAHLPAAASPELVIAYLYRDGAVIIDEAISHDVCDATLREMQPYIEDTSNSSDDFLGKNTKRTGALAARSKASWEILLHPVLMDACTGVLAHQLLKKEAMRKPAANLFAPGNFAPGYALHPWQLHLTQIIQIGPGNPAQPIHRDRWAFIGDSAFEKSGMEPELSTIWALTDFTLESGPTRVIPGSHRWPASQVRYMSKEDQASLREQAAHAVMSKGSVVIYTGSTYHSGGHNQSSQPRVGLNVDYNLAWLRQEENQYLSCPPSVAKDLPAKLQNLLGYQMGGFALGYFSDGKDPKESWKDNRPVNWASDRQHSAPEDILASKL
eukprot:gnl/TRDRNA2_/TRDRNA2_140918_c0_seq1.p1 gnl/TRDRNA2_/TRDRNA2_140918_c0~~gnl/TRDRNA2_/TRDRNA2_140918_c0_seq1.p1  ORF type:complete len:362 (+),score=58.71 gnl/TRDRNA2_/TRDRNA2_140918_c0_seq1:51-1136(+)